MNIILILSLILCLPVSSFAKGKAKSQTPPKPSQITLAIAKELQSTKTVRDWLNKGGNGTKKFRRGHFSKKMDIAIPPVLAHGNAILVFSRGKKAKPDLFKVLSKNQTLKFIWNGKDITRKPGESMDQWFKRSFPDFNKTAQWNLQDLFIDKAHADTIDDLNSPPEGLGPMIYDKGAVSYWTAIIGSMGNDQEWLNETVFDANGNGGYLSEGANLIESSKWLKENYGLNCGSGGEAYFMWPVALDSSSLLNVQTSYDRAANLARVNLERKKDFDGDGLVLGKLGRIAYHVNTETDAATLDIPKGSDGAAFLYNAYSNKSTNYTNIYNDNFNKELYLITNQMKDMVMADANAERIEAMGSSMEKLQVASDYSRACCSNIQCRTESGLEVKEVQKASN